MATFPQLVELYAGTLGWLDITADVRQGVADSGGGISIKRGRTAEGQQTDPGSMSMVLNNGASLAAPGIVGRYSPRNPHSDLYGLIGRNTPVRVAVVQAVDGFGRTVAGEWGQADTGQDWTTSGTTSHSVSGGQGLQSHDSVNALRWALLDLAAVDTVQTIDVTVPELLTGAAFVVGLMARAADVDDCYWPRARFEPGGSMRLEITRRAGAVTTVLAGLDPHPSVTYTPGTRVRVMSGAVGAHLAIKIWRPDVDPEPLGWDLEATDTVFTGHGLVGVASFLVAGNTNPLPFTPAYDNYRVVDPRAYQEISAWPPRWNLAGTDAWVPAEAAGILRRLRQGNKAVMSALRRTIAASGPVAYWPVEDGPSSGQVASALPGGTPLTVTGAAEFVTPDDVALTTSTIHYGTSAVANIAGGGTLSAALPADATTATAAGWTAAVAAQIPGTSNLSGNVALIEITTPGGTFERWQLRINAATSHTQIVAITSGGAETVVADDPGITTSFEFFDFSVWQSGGTIQAGYSWSTFGGTFNVTGSIAGTLTGATRVEINSGGATATAQMLAGHVTLWATHPLPVEDFPTDANGNTSFGALQSYRLEAAHARLARLCAEVGVPLTMPAVSADAAVLMGWQKPGTFAGLVNECVAADGGILYEARDSLGLVYAPRESLYNRAPIPLTYQHLSPPFDPVDDDDAVRNDIGVKRTDGSSARAVLDSGPLSILPPPDGVGVYDESVELNLASDDPLPDRAGWLLHLGTVDEARYPQVHVNLASPIWAADPALAAQITALDSGGVLTVDGLPTWLPPGPAKIMVQGYQETLDAYQWDIVVNGTPGSAWDVAEVDGVQRVAAGGSTLAANVTAADSTILIASPGGLWTTDPADFPLDIMVGGLPLTLSAIAGGSSPQTATVSGAVGWPRTTGMPVDVRHPAIVPL